MKLILTEIQGMKKEMNVKFEQIDKRFDSIDARFLAVDERFDSMDARFGERFDSIDEQLVANEKRLDSIDTQMIAIDKRFNSVDTQVIAINKRFNSVDERLERIETGQEKILIEMRSNFRYLEGTIKEHRVVIDLLQSEIKPEFEIIHSPHSFIFLKVIIGRHFQ